MSLWRCSEDSLRAPAALRRRSHRTGSRVNLASLLAMGVGCVLLAGCISGSNQERSWRISWDWPKVSNPFAPPAEELAQQPKPLPEVPVKTLTAKDPKATLQNATTAEDKVSASKATSTSDKTAKADASAKPSTQANARVEPKPLPETPTSPARQGFALTNPLASLWKGAGATKEKPAAEPASPEKSATTKSTKELASGDKPKADSSSQPAAAEVAKSEPVTPRKGESDPAEPKVAAAAYEAELAKGKDLEKASKLAEARAVYESLVAKHPDRFEAYHRMALLADAQHGYQDSEAFYTQALQLSPENADVFADLGYSFYLQGKFAQAERSMRKAIEIKPEEQRYHNQLGLIFGRTGRVMEAMKEFRLSGSEADAQCNMALLCLANGDSEGARKSLEWALAADAKHERSRQMFEMVQASRDPDKLAAAAKSSASEPAATTGNAPAQSHPARVAKSDSSMVRTTPYNAAEGPSGAGLARPVSANVAEPREEPGPADRPTKEMLLEKSRALQEAQEASTSRT